MNPGGRAENWKGWWTFDRAALLALLAVSAVYLEQTVVVDLVRLTSRFVFTAVEPQPVAGALRVAAGRPLYGDWQAAPPFIPLTYGPLTYWLPGWAARMMGMGNALGVLRAGRVMTLLGALGVYVLIALLARRRGVSAAFAWTAPLAVAWFPYILEWSVRFTPDAPALFFSLAGWWAAGKRGGRSAECGMQETGVRSQETECGNNIEGEERNAARPSIMRLIIAGALWAVGIFFKPTILAGEIAWLVEAGVAWQRRRKVGPLRGPVVFADSYPGLCEYAPPGATEKLDPSGVQVDSTGRAVDSVRASIHNVAGSIGGWRPALVAFGVAGVLILAGGLLINYQTGGLWRSHAVESMAVCRFSPRYAWESLLNLRPSGVALLGAMIVFALAGVRRSPLFLAFFVSLAVDLSLMAKQGSNVNYLMGSLALWAVAAAGSFEALWRGEVTQKTAKQTQSTAMVDTPSGIDSASLTDPMRRRVDGAFVLAVALLLLAGVPRAGVVAREMTIPPDEELQKIDAAIAPLAGRGVLSIDPFYGLSRGVPILYADAYHAELLAAAGNIEMKPELENIRAGVYQAIITNYRHHTKVTWHDAPVCPPEVGQAVKERYRLVYGGAWLALWVPK